MLDSINIFSSEELQTYWIRKCIVGNSKILPGQLRLIATIDLNPFEIVTLYPPHYVILYDETGHAKSVVNLYDNRKVNDMDRIVELALTYSLEHNKIDELKTMSLVGDPSIISNSNFIGHMANDALNTGYENNVGFGNQVIAGINCRPLIVLKPIKKGEEIFVDYGENYWKSKLDLLK